MTQFPKLARAPIHEALIDVRVKARDGLQIAVFDNLQDELGTDFPESEPMHAVVANIQFNGIDKPSADISDTGRKGRLYKSEDSRLLLQCRNDGMTVNRLAPYSSFDELFEVFARCWNIYERVARPSLVVRLGLRYINRFAIPPKGTVTEYITSFPRIELDEATIQGFDQTMRIGFDSRPEGVILRTALELGVEKQGPTAVIDVDASRSAACDTSLESFRNDFFRLRDIKNQIFFSVLGQTALTTFQ